MDQNTRRGEWMKVKERQYLGSTAACTLRGMVATNNLDNYPVHKDYSSDHPNPQVRKRV